MKLTNILLIILICIVGIPKFQSRKKTVYNKPTVSIKKREYKTIQAESRNIEQIKHSSTFRDYIDTDGRNTVSLNHNIRIGKDYLISGGVSHRKTSYDKEDISGTVSITKWW